MTCPRRCRNTGSPACDRVTAGAWWPSAGPRRTRPGVAPPVVLAATNARALEVIDLDVLRRYAVDVPEDLSSLE